MFDIHKNIFSSLLKSLGSNEWRLSHASLVTLLLALVIKLWRYTSHQPTKNRLNEDSAPNHCSFDKDFWRKLLHLLHICFPKLWNTNVLWILLYTFLLLAKTKLTILFARLIGKTGRSLVEFNLPSFYVGVANIAVLSIPATTLQIGLEYLYSMLQIRFRVLLMKLFQQKVFKNITNTHNSKQLLLACNPSNTISTIDQTITEDVQEFCRELLDLFRSVFKPVIDIVFLSSALYNNSGFSPSGFVASYYLLIATLLSSSLSKFTEMLTISQEKEGKVRSVYNQITLHAEEISFYGGEAVEEKHIDKITKSLLRHELKIKKLKWWRGLFDSFLIKYGSVCCGYVVCAAVVADNRHLMSANKLAELYLQTTQLYIPMSRAIGQLLLLHKKISALRASTDRLGELYNTFNTNDVEENANDLSKDNNNIVLDVNSIEDNNASNITFSNVKVQAPNGVCLIENFNFTFEPGKHVLISGCNGSGKSSLVRLIGGLWLPESGYVHTPNADKIYILPQRCYLPPGTLRDQLTYPIKINDTESNHFSDSELLYWSSCMGVAELIEREGGLDSTRSWNDVLSGGERQRIALVRVLVNKPVFAILDECTSAIAQEDEVSLLKYLQHAGITLITISHRQTLTSIHNIMIELTEHGSYNVQNIISASN